MKPEEKSQLLGLLTESPVLSLSVLVDQLPYVGLLPFAATERLDAVIIHASGIAKHSSGLGDGAPFSVLIHEAVRSDLDPLQIPRVMLHGTVGLIAKGSEDYREGREIYLRKFPSAAQTFALGDFNLFRLGFSKGRFVVGFGRTLNLKTETLQQLSVESQPA